MRVDALRELTLQDSSKDVPEEAFDLIEQVRHVFKSVGYELSRHDVSVHPTFIVVP